MSKRVFLHGTGARFDRFDLAYAGAHGTSHCDALWLTEWVGMAERFALSAAREAQCPSTADAAVLTVEVDASRLYTHRGRCIAPGAWWPYACIEDPTLRMPQPQSAEPWLEWARAEGYAGVVFTDMYDNIDLRDDFPGDICALFDVSLARIIDRHDFK